MKFKISIILSCILTASLFAQKKPVKAKVKLQHADLVERNPDKYEGNQFLTGNVVIEYKGDLVYADSAVLYQDKNLAVVWSNSRLVSKDKTITADKMEYDGNTTIAKAFKNVVLTDPGSRITADYMEYNRTNEIATGIGKVEVKTPTQQISSEKIIYERLTGNIIVNDTYKTIGSDGTLVEGRNVVYNINSKSANFGSEVFITNKDYTIYSRKMTTNDLTGITTFRDYSKITRRNDPSQYIITSDGDFNKKTGEAWLRNNSQVFYQGKMLTAKKLYFNDKTGFGKGEGDVFLDDPKEKRFLRGDYGEAFRYLDSAYVTKNAYAVKSFDKDSLYISADTLLAVKRHDVDSTSFIKAYHKARFYKSNANGKADSLVFNQTKGIMQFYKDPILWSGDNQVTGDYMEAYTNTKTNKMDSLKVFNNAFVIAKVDSLVDNEFHQIKGKYLTVLFQDDKIDFVNVEENAVALTYMDDTDAKTKKKERYGVNISYCGIIEVDVVGKDVELVACRIKSDGKMYPLSQFPDELRYLPDFKWRISERLNKWRDIFVESK
ncbi:OstA-like protein [Algoriella xinjiangensis]|uniref:OstA-like protein n=1 Tax=Algoriella xinjiangensis TaxID=684065 RepID=A0A1I4S5B4_9FLAO|nr:OstA-like protein [Algoriella xinjiangensis]SFM59682.1 OstA-like protein [Algoriella xinjiangensis]VDH15908.1 Organic solvent tolerance protein OstA [Algoriella xinjiangensis]